MEQKKTVTMQDVADAAGVSKSTVSFILNGRDDLRISEQTKKKVWQVINMLNYRPNLYAKKLRGSQMNKVIAFYMDPSLSDLEKFSFFGFFETAAKLLLESGQRAQLLLELDRLENVDAIVTKNLSKPAFMALAECIFIPLIAGDCIINDPFFYEVCLDYPALKRQADTALPEGYSYVCIRPRDEVLCRHLEEAFPSIHFAESYSQLLSLDVEAAFVTDPVLEQFLRQQGTRVFYPKGLLERQVQLLLECTGLAVSHESRDQHDFTVF